MNAKYLKIVVGLFVAGILAGAVFLYAPVSPFKRYPWSEPTPEAEPEGISVEVVAENLSAPWSIDFIDDDTLLFTERPGTVRMIENGQLLEKPLLELPDAPSEGGTLGIAVDQNFETSRYVYVYHTTSTDNRISRYRLVDDELVGERVILSGIPAAATHNGGRIKFGPDGNLYAGAGDAGNSSLAQNPGSLAGKILRLRSDGSIPIDNPFPDSYVYSLGHRNVQGLAWDGEGNLYVTEHGPQAHDEINLIEPGANYGWPIHTGEIDLTNARPGVTDYHNPVLESGNTTWAPSGATFYDGATLSDEWRSTLVFAGLRSRSLWRFNPDSEKLEQLFNDKYGRLRDVRQAPDGALYILTSNRDGRGSPAENDDRILRINTKSE